MLLLILCIIIINIQYIYQKKPNLVFIIADDLGLTDVGFRSENQIKTPNIDGLFNNGIYLDNYYVMPVCSPTRASIITGRYPLRMGLQDYVIFPRSPYGVHLNETLLVSLLKNNGYNTHAVGKWHMGHHTWKHTPTFRGFDTFYGFYTGGEDYYNHLNEQSFDFRYDKEPNCGLNCTNILYDTKGQYSTELFTNRAVDIINNYNNTQPLYLYVAYQAVHSPPEVPDRYLVQYNNTIKDKNRKIFAAMLSCMDEGIGNITNALKKKGIYEDTYIIFTGDNGGPITENGCKICGDYVGSNNSPYRGGKHSFYDGGIKAVGIINGPNIPHQTYNGLLHSVDWLPTICTMLNISYINKTLPLDGYNQWYNIINNKVSERTNITINIEMSNPDGPRAAYRGSNYKILVGPCGPPYTTPPVPKLEEFIESYISPGQQIKYDPSPVIKELLKQMDFNETSRLELYDIINDPYETNNVIQVHEDEAEILLRELVKEYKVMFPAYNPYYKDPQADAGRINNTWVPWMDEE